MVNIYSVMLMTIMVLLKWNDWHRFLWLYCMTLIVMFMGPTWGPSGADRTQVGPMLAPWILLSWDLPATMYVWEVFCYAWQWSYFEFNLIEYMIEFIMINARNADGLLPSRWAMCAWWWRHQMEISSAILVPYEGNPPVTGGFSSRRLVTRSNDVFFDLCLKKKRFNKQSRRR